MQKYFDQEKELRAKGVADPQILEMRQHLSKKGITTIWDIQDAYDADYFGLKDRCPFGSRGLCCRNCNIGPCRLMSDEMPEYAKAIAPSLNRSGCGKTADMMVATMYLQTILRGTVSHLGHAIHVVKIFKEVFSPSSVYKIKDENKMTALARELGIDTNKSKEEIAKEIYEKAKSDLFGNEKDEPMDFARALFGAEGLAELEKNKLFPKKGAAEEIIAGFHSTAQGNTSHTYALIYNCLKMGVIDMVSLFMATQLQDILLGLPSLKISKIGIDVLKKDEVNIVIHGHLPLLPEKIIEKAKELESEAKNAGAKGINIVGICCSGNEILMRHGIPMAGSTIMQELVLGTGLVDAMCVDVQCIYPSLSGISKNFHTKLITTMPEARLLNETYIPFDADNAYEVSSRIIREAIQAFSQRDSNNVFLPQAQGHSLIGGFCAENVIQLLQKSDPSKNPLEILSGAIKKGDIYGIALLAGCLSSKIQTDMSFVKIAEELIKNNILVLATGCAATSLARHGFLTSEASEKAGPKIKPLLQSLGKLAGLNASLPPVWHFGSCVDNSRAVYLASALAKHLGEPIHKLPLVASAAEQAVEKAAAIYLGAVAIGVTTHIGVMPKLGGSDFIMELLANELKKITGSQLMIIIDPDESARQLIESIKQKRKELNLVY